MASVKRLFNRYQQYEEAFQPAKTLTKQHGKLNTIQYKDGKCLIEGEDKTKRWRECCSELYTLQNNGDQSLQICQEPTEEGEFPILKQEVESSTKTLQCGKAAVVDNVFAELITHGGQPVVEVLLLSATQYGRRQLAFNMDKIDHHHYP